MKKPFRYTTTFSDILLASGGIDSQELNISKASLESLRDIIPQDVDLDKNIDLLAVAFNGAVVNKFNKNGDGIDSKSAVNIIDQFKHKPTNIEHQKQKIVGHIVSASFSEFDTNKIISKEEALNKAGPFNIALASLIYKSVNPEFAKLVEESVDEESDLYHKVSASWEIGFNDYVLAIGSDNLEEAEIIEDEEMIEELKSSLKAYGGDGKTKDGKTINRLIVGEIYPLGIGFTANPAAEVKGLTVGYSEKNQESAIKSKKNISQIHNSDVINKKSTIMDNNEILNNLVSALEDKVSNKKFSEEAVATVSKIINDAILERNNSFIKDKEQLENEKAELAKAAEENSVAVKQLQQELAAAADRVSELEQGQKQSEAIARFDSRMSMIEEIYELDDESRKIVAHELKDIDETEESLATFQEKLSVVLRHQNKEFIAKQEEEFNSKLAEAVEKRIAELKSENSSEDEAVEEALDSVSNESEVVANNNAESSEEEVSLKQKFQNAFSEENLTINY
jgi:hypothetical protein|tara:strand:- start:4271 stop:5800 length:1530 start_codon:yes stop_codon:yes gene_type:complete